MTFNHKAEKMTALPIITAPDPRLKLTARLVPAVGQAIAQLMRQMADTMYEAPGIGLAVLQVGQNLQVIVVDIGNDENPDLSGQLYMMANPVIEWVSDEWCLYKEGCLSLPDQYAEVERPASVRVRYRDEHNRDKTLTAEGLLATCIQHEIDHLKGVLFVDHISKLRRDVIYRRLLKQRRVQPTTLS